MATPKQLRFTDQDPVFVYGSNLKGINGKGAALHAANYYAAQSGLGFGPSGHSYAIPTKSDPYTTLGLHQIETYCHQFLDHARNNPQTLFLLTEIGCGLAGYTPEQIAPFFLGVGPNVVLPGSFRQVLTQGMQRVAVVGSRGFEDYPRMKCVLDEIVKPHKGLCVVSGGAKGADSLAEQYAQERSFHCLVVLANWKKLGKKAGILRNDTMMHLSNQVIAFWDGQSPGTKSMIENSQKAGKSVTVIRTD